MPEFWDEQLVGLASTRLNQRPVSCDWCKANLPAFNAVKVMCSEEDPSDYFWACEACWEEKRFG
jgi:hypothetical protein